MGQFNTNISNSIKVKREKDQRIATLDNTELVLSNDETTLDLTELTLSNAEQIEEIQAKLNKLLGGK